MVNKGYMVVDEIYSESLMETLHLVKARIVTPMGGIDDPIEKYITWNQQPRLYDWFPELNGVYEPITVNALDVVWRALNDI